ncbi:MAG: TerB family tellurite resistance protein [Acidobacteria bacterium]|nr:TerB family tellurite resistance protein [Acidobacteriota bacterium]
MIVGMSIFRLFRMNVPEARERSTETETVRKITEALDRMEPQRAKFLAAFAYLLGRVARADLKITPEEIHVMERIVMEHGGLPEEQAVLVIQIAKTQNVLFGGTENYLVTREFREMAGHEEKMALLDCLFAVASADKSISTIEDNEISQIADELRIEHRDFISVRSRYRDSLAVLKNSQEPQ